ncbi:MULTISPECIES: hypothetical protein [unclassified Cryobacterium]|uniref:hypothetical protein n=1 Tax=unclassified Cryobacterium TaxID=2649013 RepID=UPI002B225E53|nr:MULTISPECIES: hypothetical protein [Cryobacterium]MEB0303864.1 hypothetical protein [Cryobacterium sp. 10I1]MEC5148747.1 hypothetical protein [Cryobacterium psychrotolerans]
MSKVISETVHAAILSEIEDSGSADLICAFANLEESDAEGREGLTTPSSTFDLYVDGFGQDPINLSTLLKGASNADADTFLDAVETAVSDWCQDAGLSAGIGSDVDDAGRIHFSVTTAA